jgi:hypothetical protein
LPERTRRPARVRIPGERYFRDGDVTIAFVGVGVKTLAASLANLEIV